MQAALKDKINSSANEIERKAKEKRDAARASELKVKEQLREAVERGRQRDMLSAPSTAGKNLA